MFGPKYRVGWDDKYIVLRPFRKSEMADFAEMFSSPRIHRFTLSARGYTQQMEEEWFDKTQNSDSDVVWAIQPEGVEHVVGVTGIHKIDRFHSCSTGIIICDPQFWGEGVASRAHLARTLYAATTRDRATIQSEVMSGNSASLKALKRVGYMVTGTSFSCRMVAGDFVNSHLLTWYNPKWLPRLFPDGVPSKFARAIQLAQETLDKAKEVVEEL